MSTPTERVEADPTQLGIDAVKGMSEHWKQSNEGLLAALEAAQALVKELEDWKAQMLQVWSEIDSQKIAAMLGATAGKSCFAVINQRVPEVIAELAQSEAGAAVMRRCLEEIARPALGGKLQQYAAREALKAANLALGGEG